MPWSPAGSMPGRPGLVRLAPLQRRTRMKKVQKVETQKTIARALEALSAAERELAVQLREVDDEELKVVAGGLYFSPIKPF
jgi:hypothetical protein